MSAAADVAAARLQLCCLLSAFARHQVAPHLAWLPLQLDRVHRGWLSQRLAATSVRRRATATSMSAGTLVVRNMPTHTAKAFGEAMGECARRGRWRRRLYQSFSGLRDQVDGIELATNISGSYMLPPHNEMVYCPEPSDLQVMGCCVPAERGGESIMARNRDLHAAVAEELKEFVAQHGGVRYQRKYHDANAPGPRDEVTFGSWQVSLFSFAHCCGCQCINQQRATKPGEMCKGSFDATLLECAQQSCVSGGAYA